MLWIGSKRKGILQGAARRVSAYLVESVQGSALTLEGVDHIECGDGLPLSVVAVRDGVSHHVLQKGLEDGSGFLVDQSRHSLHSASSRQAADRGLGHSLDRVLGLLAVSLGAALSETFASFATSGHVGDGVVWFGFDGLNGNGEDAVECSRWFWWRYALKQAPYAVLSQSVRTKYALVRTLIG